MVHEPTTTHRRHAREVPTHDATHRVVDDALALCLAVELCAHA
jgi:hypothetical protein